MKEVGFLKIFSNIVPSLVYEAYWKNLEFYQKIQKIAHQSSHPQAQIREKSSHCYIKTIGSSKRSRRCSSSSLRMLLFCEIIETAYYAHMVRLFVSVRCDFPFQMERKTEELSIWTNLFRPGEIFVAGGDPTSGLNA